MQLQKRNFHLSEDGRIEIYNYRLATPKENMNIKKISLPIGHLRSLIDERQTTESDSRTVELTWTTGSKGLRRGWDGDYFEELSMDPGHVDMSRLQTGAPLLNTHNNHDLNAVIGVVERAWLEGDKGKALVRFSSDPESDKIYQKVKEKILRNVSVGYNVRKYQNVTLKGEDTPTYRAVDWQPLEISIVPIGFDQNAQVRSQEKLTEVEILDTPQKENMKTKNEILAEERVRVSQIRAAVKEAGITDETFTDNLIAQDEMTAETALPVIYKRALHDLKNKNEPQTAIQSYSNFSVGSSGQERMRESLTESLAARIDKTYKPKTDTRDFDNRTLIENVTQYMGRKSLETANQLAQRSLSTGDFSAILAAASEKAAQNRYQLTPKTYSAFVKKDFLKDYKTNSLLRAGDFPELLERPEGAEVQYGNFGEEREQITLRDFSRAVSFTSKCIQNDDLRLLAQVANEGGMAASRLENKLCYEALQSSRVMADGAVLYDAANHGNLGTPGAISETTLTEAFKGMRKQLSVDGTDTINALPKYFICGPDQEIAARKFFATINPVQSSNVNPFSNMLEIICDSQIVGNSYFFATDQVLMPTVVLYHLENQDAPTISSRVNFNTNSLDLKIDFACAAAAMDWRGLYKNAGQ